MNLDKLLTEQPNPASDSIDALPTEDVLKIINSEDHRVAESVAREIPQIAKAVDRIVAALESGGRLFYIGAGTSGRLGVLDASECPPTFSVPPDLVQGIIAGGEGALSRATETTEDDPAIGVRDLQARGFGSADVLCGMNLSAASSAIRAAFLLPAPISWPAISSSPGPIPHASGSSTMPWIRIVFRPRRRPRNQCGARHWACRPMACCSCKWRRISG